MSSGLSTWTLLVVLALNCFAVLPGTAKLQCRDGFQYHSSHSQEFCFQVNLTPKTFQEASGHCYANGGHLAEPRTYLKDLSLTLFLRQKGYLNNNHWIGLTKDPNSYFKWMWKGTGMADEGYSQWQHGRGDIYGAANNKRCVYKSGGTRSMWVATNCKDALKLHFVCEQGRIPLAHCSSKTHLIFPKGYSASSSAPNITVAYATCLLQGMKFPEDNDFGCVQGVAKNPAFGPNFAKPPNAGILILMMGRKHPEEWRIVDKDGNTRGVKPMLARGEKLVFRVVCVKKS